jgi:hypothetical protein
MDDDAALPHARRGSAARNRRATGAASSTLTPPIGMAPVPPDPAPPAASPVAPVQAPPLPAGPDAAVGLCVCLHDRAAHEHYRRGSDCGVCGAEGCAAYRRRGGALRRSLRRIGLVR